RPVPPMQLMLGMQGVSRVEAALPAELPRPEPLLRRLLMQVLPPIARAGRQGSLWLMNKRSAWIQIFRARNQSRAAAQEPAAAGCMQQSLESEPTLKNPSTPMSSRRAVILPRSLVCARLGRQLEWQAQHWQSPPAKPEKSLAELMDRFPTRRIPLATLENEQPSAARPALRKESTSQA